MEREFLQAIAIVVAIGSGYIFGAFAYMNVERELKDIKRRFMEIDAEIRRLERRIL